MKKGINIEYVEVDTGMEMKRIKINESSSQNPLLDERHMFCFHVRSPRDAIHEEEENSFTYCNELSFESGQEIHIRDAMRPHSHIIITLKVHSFIPASDTNRKHGILWCCM